MCIRDRYTYRHGKTLLNPYAELVLEVLFANMSQFHLQDQLADHALFLCESQRPENRKNALAQLIGIGLELMLVLEVSALHMREGGYTEADHVRAGP